MLKLAAPVLKALLDAHFLAVFRRFIITAPFRQIGLGDEAALVVMAIQVFFTIPELFCPLVMAVPEVLGNGQCASFADVLLGGEQAGLTAIAFRCRGNVEGGMCQRNLRLGQTNEISCLLGGHRHSQGV